MQTSHIWQWSVYQGELIPREGHWIQCLRASPGCGCPSARDRPVPTLTRYGIRWVEIWTTIMSWTCSFSGWVVHWPVNWSHRVDRFSYRLMIACHLVRQETYVMHPSFFCYVILAFVTTNSFTQALNIVYSSFFICTSCVSYGFHKSACLYNVTSYCSHPRACSKNFLESINESTMCYIILNSQHDAWIFEIMCDVQDHVQRLCTFISCIVSS